jgi:small subunit ribosomal protein S14
MATKAQVADQKKQKKFKVRKYNRCGNCGRARGYIRKFDLCRVCFREFAHAGKLPGVKKSSW